MEAFDDRKLINLARYHLYSAKEEAENANVVRKLLEKDKLSNPERNTLLEFIESNKYTRPLSIKEMKQEIFSIIGQSSPNAWGTTVSRGELELIYNWIKAKK